MSCNCGQNTFRKFLPGFSVEKPQPKIIKKNKKEIKEKIAQAEENVPETKKENEGEA